jgi:hypothetical protein
MTIGRVVGGKGRRCSTTGCGGLKTSTGARDGANARLAVVGSLSDNAAPFGSAETAFSAGGNIRRRRASHPGSDSIDLVGVSRPSRSRMSRYFRSITGQL